MLTGLHSKLAHQWARSHGHVIYAGNAAQAFGAGSEPPLDVLTSVAGQQKVILGISQKQTGMFLNWNGEKLDW